jgi:hypothetical protein
MRTTFCLIQDKYKCICLGLSQAHKPVRLYSVHTVKCTMYSVYSVYNVYSVYSVQCAHCTNQLLETSSAVLCTHSTAKLQSHLEATYPPKLDLSPGGPERGQLTAHPTTQWEGPLSRVCNPFPSAGLPSLGGPRDCTPPRGAIVAAAKAPATLATLLSMRLAL